jgi:hypothetical protein
VDFVEPQRLSSAAGDSTMRCPPHDCGRARLLQRLLGGASRAFQQVSDSAAKKPQSKKREADCHGAQTHHPQ